MPREMQQSYLRTTLEDIGKLKDAPSVVYKYWREGDAAGLAGYVHHQVETVPALFERLVFQRNRHWLKEIEGLIAGDKDAMVIVGALHLVGRRGLVSLLEQAGYEVTRP